MALTALTQLDVSSERHLGEASHGWHFEALYGVAQYVSDC